MTALSDLLGLCHACVLGLASPRQCRFTLYIYSCLCTQHMSNAVRMNRPFSGVSPRHAGESHTARKHMQFGVFWTNGQICSSTSRLLVQEGIAPAFYEHLKKRAESIKQCDPLTEDCRMGPVVNQDQYDKILGFIEVMSVSTRQQLLSCEAAYLACMCKHSRYDHRYASCTHPAFSVAPGWTWFCVQNITQRQSFWHAVAQDIAVPGHWLELAVKVCH